MSTLIEIEAAAEALPKEQKEELFRFLADQLRRADAPARKGHLIRCGNDALLEAPPDAPPMTPENVKRMLADCP